MKYILSEEEYQELKKYKEEYKNLQDIMRAGYDEQNKTYVFTMGQYRAMHIALLGHKGSAFKVKTDMQQEATTIFPN